MTISDESVQSNRKIQTFNTYQRGERARHLIDDGSPLMKSRNPFPSTGRRIRRQLQGSMSKWVPDEEESSNHHRSIRRRIFLLITEPETSFLSAVFYFFLIAAIFASNIIMAMQTMDAWQFTPDDCKVCGGGRTYNFEDDDTVAYSSSSAGVECVCPPEPKAITRHVLRWLMNFFSVEWCLRVLTFVPENPDPELFHQALRWLRYVTSPTTLLDALATFPYYLEFAPNTFISLRLLRLFRIFQLVRLGQYNAMFRSLTNVMAKSLNYLRLLVLLLGFGGALFGSMIYWLEKGTWTYYEPSKKYLFVRLAADGVTEEPSPFTSIPAAFWWFMVTATTVGYGDFCPTSTGGKWVACFAMLMGVLVIAFPVSVFSDLWSHELKEIQGFEDLQDDDEAEARAPMEANIDKSVVNEESALRQTQLPTTGPYAYHRDGIVMDREDLKALVTCVYQIKENQRQLHSILRKYRLHEDDQPGF